MTNIERLQSIGIRRLGNPKRGFRYQPVSGRLTKADLDRIENLKIPPAWTEVAINPAANGRVQVIGKDAAARWQRDREARFMRVKMAATDSLPSGVNTST